MTRAGAKRFLFLALCLAAVLLFTGLGIWQLERRVWKLDLIERVERRVHAAPVPLAEVERLDPGAAEYRHVLLEGRFLDDRVTLVDALTERGPGKWVVTPLVSKSGVVLVNRGFVPNGYVAGTIAGPVRLSGLVRVSEPGGRFLRPNRPAEERWYSRDVAAIARARGLGPKVAPIFVDADAGADPTALPVGGLTVVRFRNAHLIYALTWFALAGLSLAGLVVVARSRQEAR